MPSSHAHNEGERGVWGPRGKRNLINLSSPSLVFFSSLP